MWPIFVRLHLLAKALEGHHRTFLLQKLGNIFFFKFNLIKVNYIHLVDDLLVLQIPCITWSSLQLCVGVTMLLHLSFARLNAVFGKKKTFIWTIWLMHKEAGIWIMENVGTYKLVFPKDVHKKGVVPFPSPPFKVFVHIWLINVRCQNLSFKY